MSETPEPHAAPRYAEFDRARLEILPLAERAHDLDRSVILDPEAPPPPFEHPAIPLLAGRDVDAWHADAAVLLIMGAHVLRAGASRYLIRALRRGWLSHIAMNGAGVIHDYELARIGATTESVARYIREGQFGLWRETGEINDIIADGAQRGEGLGEAVGRAIAESDFPYRDLSVLAAAYQLGVPLSVHVGIGYDIIHEHPNCNPAALGTTSYRDFLRLAATVERLEGGVMLNIGSAVMGPEVYLKALAMARNVARQEGRQIRHFTTAVFDLIPLQDDVHREAPRGTPEYYFRPWKTILVRTVADGGESHYVRGDHRQTVPALCRAVEAALDRDAAAAGA